MHYDDWAPHYDRDMRGWGFRAPETIFSHIKGALYALPDQAQIADIGIGTGALSDKCQKLRPDLNIHGVDISNAMLTRCAQRHPSFNFYRSDITVDTLPFEDKSMHITLASGLMENIDNISHAINQMARITKKDGLLVFTYAPCILNERMQVLRKRLRPGRTDEGKLQFGDLHLYRHNPEIVRHSIENAGMRVVREETFTGYRTYVVMTVRYNLIIARKL